mmetsp:Transcript_18553/g.27158  ORF Transcript_18553/g.27158 Transcript_18553/m.27158 type:complete len:493 (+) Transcript_18553:34-1512(+)
MVSMKHIFILVCLTLLLTTAPPAVLVGAFLLCPYSNKERTTATFWRSNDVLILTARSASASDAPPCSSNVEENSTPSQLCQASFERWLRLPESWAKAKKNTTHNQHQEAVSSSSKKEAYQKNIQTLSIDHPLRLGVTQKQRSAEVIHAAERGNATRLVLLLREGAHVDAKDLYRITGLHYAAARGHFEAVRVLLRWGATIVQEPVMELESGSSSSGSSPLRAAFANGHFDIVALLNRHSGVTTISSYSNTDAALLGQPPPVTHFNDPAVQLQHQLFGPSQSSNNIRTTTVIPLDADHAGAGSFYIDHAFHAEFIDKLVTLHASLRKHHHHRSSHHNRPQSTNAARRSHYCDTEGWLCVALSTALRQQSHSHHVFSRFRFISYLGENATTSFLAPHTDLPVLDRSNDRTSTHTFILYLTTVDRGGETVLLDHLPSSSEKNVSGSIIRCAVKPVLGRLFVFPHGCPHAGRHVVKGSKLILRGDICVQKPDGAAR